MQPLSQTPPTIVAYIGSTGRATGVLSATFELASAANARVVLFAARQRHNSSIHQAPPSLALRESQLRSAGCAALAERVGELRRHGLNGVLGWPEPLATVDRLAECVRAERADVVIIPAYKARPDVIAQLRAAGTPGKPVCVAMADPDGRVDV